jgi:hypothetical protein
MLDPASVDFLLPYQHQSEAIPWYGVKYRKMVLDSHDLLFSSSSKTQKVFSRVFMLLSRRVGFPRA